MYATALSAAFIVLMAAMPLGAQTTVPTATPAGADDQKKICETVQPTGSRLGAKRVCHTRAEWQQVRDIGSKLTSDAQRLNLQGKSPGE